MNRSRRFGRREISIGCEIVGGGIYQLRRRQGFQLAFNLLFAEVGGQVNFLPVAALIGSKRKYFGDVVRERICSHRARRRGRGQSKPADQMAASMFLIEDKGERRATIEPDAFLSFEHG